MYLLTTLDIVDKVKAIEFNGTSNMSGAVLFPSSTINEETRWSNYDVSEGCQ